jgi:hypothetical protein
MLTATIRKELLKKAKEKYGKIYRTSRFDSINDDGDLVNLHYLRISQHFTETCGNALLWFNDQNGSTHTVMIKIQV